MSYLANDTAVSTTSFGEFATVATHGGSGGSLVIAPIGLFIARLLLGPPRDPREIDQDTDCSDSTFVPSPETPESPQPVHEVAQFAVGGNAYFVEVLRGTAKADHLVGNGGLSGFEGDDTLTGGDRADILMGGAANDLLVGGLGHDILTGGLGADILDGGEGFDLASYAQSSAGVVANLSNAAENTGEAAGDRYKSIEGVSGSAYDDEFAGNNAANELYGKGGDDTLRAGLGLICLMAEPAMISPATTMPSQVLWPTCRTGL